MTLRGQIWRHLLVSTALRQPVASMTSRHAKLSASLPLPAQAQAKSRRLAILRNMMLSTALLICTTSGVAQAACVETGVLTNVYICSGESTTEERGLVFIPRENVDVSTSPGFGITLVSPTDSFAAIEIVGNGQFSYIDNNQSKIDARAGTSSVVNAALFTIFGSISEDDQFYLRSNGDFLSSNAPAIIIQGQGGAPELGFTDAEFLGNIFAQNSTGIIGFSPGRGARIVLNNVDGGLGGVDFSLGSLSNDEADAKGDLVIDANGTIRGRTVQFDDELLSSYAFRFSLNADDGERRKLESGVAVRLNVAEGSLVEGSLGAVLGVGNTQGLSQEILDNNPIIVNNSGIMRNLSTASSDRVISGVQSYEDEFGEIIVFGDVRFEVNNDHHLIGTVTFGRFGDRISNTGLWNTAGGANDFGDGADLVLNMGEVRAAQDGAVGESTTFANLNSFTNRSMGILRMDDGGTGDRTTLGGDYAGEGGTLALDTFLGDDLSPTDLLRIDGATSGATGVTVNNINGPGALTDIGIKIVDVGIPERSTGEFLLANPDYIIRRTGEAAILAGAYGYALRQGRMGTNDDFGDWYLQSEWQPAAPVYEAYPSALLGAMGAGMPRLQERLGDRHWAQASAPPETSQPAPEPTYVFCKDATQAFRCAVTPEQAQVYADPAIISGTPDGATVIDGQGLWVRADGSMSRTRPVSSTTGAAYDASTSGLQIGYDHVLTQTASGGKVIGGINLSYRMAGADVSSAVGLGTIETKGYTLGASLTWYEPNGFYLDAQAQVMRLESDLSADGLGVFAEGLKADGYGLSLEIGKEFALGGAWAITPQAQLSYLNLRQSGFVDAYGTSVSFEAESLQLRLGAELSNEASWQAEDGTISRRSLRAGLHVIREFNPDTVIDVAGTPLTFTRDETQAELTLGGTYSWNNDQNSLYAQVAARTGMESFGDSNSLRATIGFRRQW